MILLESGDHCDLNLNIRHTYLNIKINNQEKPCMSDHWPLRATKVAKYTKNSNLSFSSKNDTFRIWRSLWSEIQILDTLI